MLRTGTTQSEGVTRAMRFRRLALPTLLALGASLSCAHFASDADTLEADESLTPGAPDWDCEGSLVAIPITTNSAERLTFPLRVISLISRDTPPNLKVRACFSPDLTCSQPVTLSLGPDADGIVRLPLPVGFTGFLEMTSDDQTPSLVVFGGALTPEVAAQFAEQIVVLVPQQGSAPFVDALRLSSRAGTGTVLLNLLDCAGHGAAGIRVALEPTATPFSIVDGLPIVGRDTTTNYAVAGFVNVSPGIAVASGYRSGGEQVHFNALPVRAGWDTIAMLLPITSQP